MGNHPQSASKPPLRLKTTNFHLLQEYVLFLLFDVPLVVLESWRDLLETYLFSIWCLYCPLLVLKGIDFTAGNILYLCFPGGEQCRRRPKRGETGWEEYDVAKSLKSEIDRQGTESPSPSIKRRKATSDEKRALEGAVGLSSVSFLVTVWLKNGFGLGRKAWW